MKIIKLTIALGDDGYFFDYHNKLTKVLKNKFKFCCIGERLSAKLFNIYRCRELDGVRKWRGLSAKERSTPPGSGSVAFGITTMRIHSYTKL